VVIRKNWMTREPLCLNCLSILYWELFHIMHRSSKKESSIALPREKRSASMKQRVIQYVLSRLQSSCAMCVRFHSLHKLSLISPTTMGIEQQAYLRHQERSPAFDGTCFPGSAHGSFHQAPTEDHFSLCSILCSRFTEIAGESQSSGIYTMRAKEVIL